MVLTPSLSLMSPCGPRFPRGLPRARAPVFSGVIAYGAISGLSASGSSWRQFIPSAKTHTKPEKFFDFSAPSVGTAGSAVRSPQPERQRSAGPADPTGREVLLSPKSFGNWYHSWPRSRGHEQSSVIFFHRWPVFRWLAFPLTVRRGGRGWDNLVRRRFFKAAANRRATSSKPPRAGGVRVQRSGRRHAQHPNARAADHPWHAASRE